MALHPLAGKLPPRELLTNVPRLVSAYYTERPDPGTAAQRVAFGTSGHRGSAFKGSFNEAHVLTICQALAEYRAAAGVTGPLFLGMDTHALSEAAHSTALEVFAAHGIEARYQDGFGYTPTPVISHAILCWNRDHPETRADGVVITPSHNPPEDGGLKYNPPHGGPADGAVTAAIETRANALLEDELRGVKRLPLRAALQCDCIRAHDFVAPYVEDLESVVDLAAVRNAGLKIGVDPMGGSGIAYWEPIAERYGLDLDLVSREVDPTFRFIRVDKDGIIRMDCSSSAAMAGLVELADRYDIAFGNDPDYDRHGIVTSSAGLMNPNHYLAAAVAWLFTHRDWPAATRIGKTLVTSAIVDRVGAELGRAVYEVPVGFKWFVEGLHDASLGFAGEESAGASFLRRDGSVWSTDKDGIILDLLAAEMTAIGGTDPATQYRALEARLGRPLYARTGAPATREQKAILKQLDPETITATELAGAPITARLTHAPGNGAPIGGLKVVTAKGWFAVRPSGTEDIYKIYAESFEDEAHLAAIQTEAQALVDSLIAD